jgi:hypothetical protein
VNCCSKWSIVIRGADLHAVQRGVKAGMNIEKSRRLMQNKQKEITAMKMETIEV